MRSSTTPGRAFTDSDLRYDVIFDTVGKLSPSDSKRSLAAGGSFLTTQTRTEERRETLIEVRDLAEAGHLRPVIDRCYPLAETADAHRYVETGRKRGNVVLVVAGDRREAR